MGGLDLFKEISKNSDSDLDIKKESFRNTITSQIYSILEEEGKNKKDLAELLQISKSAVTNLLSGDRNFQIDTISSIAHFLNRFPHLTFDKEEFLSKDWCYINVEKEEISVEIKSNSTGRNHTKYTKKKAKISAKIPKDWLSHNPKKYELIAT